MLDSINQPLLDVRDLSVAFRQGGAESVAVDKVSFSIERGQCVALVGDPARENPSALCRC
jgi:microcin C transport system ATP-binding protein